MKPLTGFVVNNGISISDSKNPRTFFVVLEIPLFVIIREAFFELTKKLFSIHGNSFL